MTNGILNELYELVVSVCDNLYAGRQLITKTSVKNIVVLHGSWLDDELELQLPGYINAWRLQTLAQDQHLSTEDRVSELETQLYHAQLTISVLKADLLELRGMLHD